MAVWIDENGNTCIGVKDEKPAKKTTRKTVKKAADK